MAECVWVSHTEEYVPKIYNLTGIIKLLLADMYARGAKTAGWPD